MAMTQIRITLRIAKRVLGRLLDVLPGPDSAEILGRRYVQPRRGDHHKDFRRVIGDMTKIGGDLRNTAAKELSRHGPDAA